MQRANLRAMIIQILTNALLFATALSSLAHGAGEDCGELVTLITHNNITARYAPSQPMGGQRMASSSRKAKSLRASRDSSGRELPRPFGCH